MRLLVSAGPTREMIDAVRYLSNLSSGRLGYAVAAAAAARDHEVHLVSGPVALSPPRGIRVTHVVSAQEMHAAIREAWSDVDALVMTAAVADYRPARRFDGKLKKSEGPLILELARNPDILKSLAPIKGDRIVVGFALEVQNAEAEARRKLATKGMDVLVLNGPDNLGSETARCRFLTESGFESPLQVTKAALAELLIDRVEALASDKGRRGP
ncbi:MAG TPA: phosphopantothenoylcysteine decarboxylase [Planctomycetes bacterium]|nr:phosphopantothenoylcysteine decarboxylase [Planctomycetota bacterium]